MDSGIGGGSGAEDPCLRWRPAVSSRMCLDPELYIPATSSIHPANSAAEYPHVFFHIPVISSPRKHTPNPARRKALAPRFG